MKISSSGNEPRPWQVWAGVFLIVFFAVYCFVSGRQGWIREAVPTIILIVSLVAGLALLIWGIAILQDRLIDKAERQSSEQARLVNSIRGIYPPDTRVLDSLNQLGYSLVTRYIKELEAKIKVLEATTKDPTPELLGPDGKKA